MKYLYFIFFFILLLSPRALTAQQENIWAFGQNAGLNFNGAGPTAITSSISSNEASASVCNPAGQLLFYTNGSNVWDRNHNLMPGGNGIINDPQLPPINPGDPADYTNSTSQGALIVPVPDQPDHYYIFSMTSAEFGNSAGRLYVSQVNMNLNSGLGDLIPTQRGLLLDSGLTEQMTAVTGDRCNIWLLTVHNTQNILQARSISTAGIDPNPVLSPLLPENYFAIIGSIHGSPDRKKLAISRLSTGLYSFDPVTGTATGTAILKLPPTGTTAYSACFSPDNSKLYTTFIPPLFGNVYQAQQFDLSSGDSMTIVNSMTIISSARLCSFKQAIDGKIYTEAMGVIRYPNLAGTACQYIPNSLSLEPGTNAVFGLPNTVPVYVRDSTHSLKNINAPCFAQQVLLQGSNNAWDYLWNGTTPGQTLVADSPGNYILTYYTAPCTFHTDTLVLRFPGGTIPQLQTQASCNEQHNGKARILHPGWDTMTYIYDWRNSDSILVSNTDSLTQAASGYYSVSITTASGCDTLLFLLLNDETHPVSFVTDTILCKGDAAQFQNTSDNIFTGFQWLFGDGSGATAVSPVHNYPAAGAYDVQLIATSTHCTDTAVQSLIVDLPTDQLSFNKSEEKICTGQSIQFSPHTDSTVLALLWSFGDSTHHSGGNESTLHAYDRDGTMPVVLTAKYRACPDVTASDTVYVFPMPVVQLGPDTSLCFGSIPLLLKDRNTQPAGYRYLWNTGDTTAGLKIKHDGTYQLSITSDQGCSTTDEIYIAKGCYLDIPNAFTPNGDGTNDYFFPRQLLSDRLSTFRMQVFNRWGQVIFETQQTDGRGWDGRFNGTDQPQGVYLYLIDALINDQHTEHYEGNVTLIR